MTSSRPVQIVGVAGVVLCGAIFGFFYAWVCSAMWGLDASEPQVAIAAMQHINESVENFVFLPAFFLTPFVLGAAAYLAKRRDARKSAALFLAAALVYLFGGMLFTIVVNVPMNDQLATVAVPNDTASAQKIWDDYSQPWQVANAVRTVLSGASLALAATALLYIRPPEKHRTP